MTHKTRAQLIAGLDSFTRSYLVTALWSSTDNSREDGGDPLDRNYGIEDCSRETLLGAIKDCGAFRDDCAEMLDTCGVDDSSQWGHDFWLTRCGHGAGFWDGGYPKHGAALTAACRPYGGVDLYVHRGRIYGA